MSNLLQLNKSLVKEVASLRNSHADACNKLARVELGLCAENGKLKYDLSSREEEVIFLREEKTSLLASQEQLQSSLTTSLAHVNNLSQELAMLRADLNQALLIEKTALAASEERLLSANCDTERLRFSNKTLDEEIIALREEATVLASKEDRLLGEKEEALRGMAEKEAALAASCERISELEKLLNAEKKAVSGARGEFDLLHKVIKKLHVEKEEAICRESSLVHQIEEERVQRQIALEAVKDEFCLKLSEASTEIKSMEKLLQQSNGEADSLRMQLQEEKMKHESEITCRQDQLNDWMKKAKDMDGFFQEKTSIIDALNLKAKEEAATHQLEKTHLQERISNMAAGMNFSAAKYQKLAAKKENLHKELSRVNQKQRETNEHSARERKSVTEAPKCLCDAERDAKQACLERERTLQELHFLKDELSQLTKERDALLADKQALLDGYTDMEAQLSSINIDKQMLAEHLQAARKALAVDKQGFLVEIRKMESAVSDLEVDQSELLKQLNVEKMAVAAAQDNVATLESSQEAWLQDRFKMRSTFSEQISAKEEALAAAEDRVAFLSDEVQNLVKQTASLKEQVTHMEILKNGVDANKLESEMSELSSSKKILHQKLQTEKDDAVDEISSLKREVNGLEQSKSCIAMDQERSGEELALLKEEKLLLEVLVSGLNVKLQQNLEEAAAEKAMQSQQLSEMEQLRKELDKLRGTNSNLMNLVKLSESKSKHFMSKKKQDEQHTSLSKLYGVLEASHTALKNELATQKATAQALASNYAVLQSNIETKARALMLFQKKVDDSFKSSSISQSQMETMSSLLRFLQEDFKAQGASVDAEIVGKASLKNALEIKSRDTQRLEEEVCGGAAKIAMMSSQLVNCREEVAQFEAVFNEASERVALLKAQLSIKATMQNELEFKGISSKNNLHTVQIASEMAEKESKANMDTVINNPDVKSRALEERLESVKKTLCDMQNEANRGQESISSSQTQLSCLMEENYDLEKKALSTSCRSIQGAKPSNAIEEERYRESSEEEASRKARDEKSKKFVRLVLPVFLITTASSLVFAGIQGYIGRPEY